MRIHELLSENDTPDGNLTELTFHCSQCTKDCSGHKAGYAWSQARGGEHGDSQSLSFNNGAYIAISNLKRTHGGGTVQGWQSQTANAIKKREKRAQLSALRKSQSATPPIPPTQM